MKKYPLILDCDPGVDDVFAILLAHSTPEIDLKVICSVSGNAGIEKTTYNAQLIAGLLGAKTIIAEGASRPLIKEAPPIGTVHGTDGLGGYAKGFGEDRLAPISSMKALDVYRKILLESEEPVYIAAVGPLTNLAILFLAYPEVKSKIAAVSIMGGGIRRGNITPYSEYNFYKDPEAADIVMKSGVKLLLCGLDVTQKATLSEKEMKSLKESQNEFSDFSVKILSSYIAKDAAIHDPCAILALTNPEKFIYEDQYVEIDTREGITRGMSYVDNRKNQEKKPNCRVFYDMDLDFFRKSMLDALEHEASKKPDENKSPNDQ
ncbi:nucleoside hydrolase [Proteiniclasticum sp. C24MP]|uniref:nucleoside hydrolase n=1 Tax=Proteiniclasticum sp. C24MP TaxID=3374101 RepID=UPI0037540139